MPYPTKNNSTYSSPSKNSSSSSNSSITGQLFLLIDSTYHLLIDTEDSLLLEPLGLGYTYQAKS